MSWIFKVVYMHVYVYIYTEICIHIMYQTINQFPKDLFVVCKLGQEEVPLIIQRGRGPPFPMFEFPTGFSTDQAKKGRQARQWQVMVDSCGKPIEFFWLVVWLPFFDVSHIFIGNFIIPIDFHIFQRGG